MCSVGLNLQASLGDARLTGKVVTSRLETLADLKSDIHISVQDIRKALQKAGVDIPLTGPLTADGTVNMDGGGYKAALETKVEGITVTINGFTTGNQLEWSSKVLPLRRVGERFGLEGLTAEALTLTGKVIQ